jgi:uncharacterized membrane protein
MTLFLKLNPLTVRVALTSLAFFVVMPSGAQTKVASSDNQKSVRTARCNYGIAHDGTNNCMSKSEFDITTSRQSALDSDPSQYLRNALVRCEGLKGADRDDCRTRIRGGGTVTGSVEAGGLYRELVTIVPAKPSE